MAESDRLSWLLQGKDEREFGRKLLRVLQRESFLAQTQTSVFGEARSAATPKHKFAKNSPVSSFRVTKSEQLVQNIVKVDLNPRELNGDQNLIDKHHDFGLEANRESRRGGKFEALDEADSAEDLKASILRDQQAIEIRELLKMVADLKFERDFAEKAWHRLKSESSESKASRRAFSTKSSSGAISRIPSPSPDMEPPLLSASLDSHAFRHVFGRSLHDRHNLKRQPTAVSDHSQLVKRIRQLDKDLRRAQLERADAMDVVQQLLSYIQMAEREREAWPANRCHGPDRKTRREDAKAAEKIQTLEAELSAQRNFVARMSQELANARRETNEFVAKTADATSRAEDAQQRAARMESLMEMLTDELTRTKEKVLFLSTELAEVSAELATERSLRKRSGHDLGASGQDGAPHQPSKRDMEHAAESWKLQAYTAREQAMRKDTIIATLHKRLLSLHPTGSFERFPTGDPHLAPQPEVVARSPQKLPSNRTTARLRSSFSNSHISSKSSPPDAQPNRFRIPHSPAASRGNSTSLATQDRAHDCSFEDSPGRADKSPSWFGFADQVLTGSPQKAPSRERSHAHSNASDLSPRANPSHTPRHLPPPSNRFDEGPPEEARDMNTQMLGSSRPAGKEPPLSPRDVTHLDRRDPRLDLGVALHRMHLPGPSWDKPSSGARPAGTANHLVSHVRSREISLRDSGGERDVTGLSAGAGRGHAADRMGREKEHTVQRTPDKRQFSYSSAGHTRQHQSSPSSEARLSAFRPLARG